MFQDSIDWVVDKWKIAVDEVTDFLIRLKAELIQTKEGAILLTKVARGETLTAAENLALKTQMRDVATGTPLLILVSLPGGGLPAIFLVKLARKYGFELMPSEFRD